MNKGAPLDKTSRAAWL